MRKFYYVLFYSWVFLCCWAFPWDLLSNISCTTCTTTRIGTIQVFILKKIGTKKSVALYLFQMHFFKKSSQSKRNNLQIIDCKKVTILHTLKIRKRGHKNFCGSFFPDKHQCSIALPIQGNEKFLLEVSF